MRAHKSAFLGLALGALALGVTACEDKDQGVVLPPPAVAISITPAGPIALEVGQSATVNANVTGGDASTDRTVTYSSSNASVAGVSGNVVTAAGPGTATITATNAANGLTASVQVVVTQPVTPPPPPPAEQPTISIKSITTGATNVPVNINNVFGQIDITLNVEIPPGNNIDSLTVDIGNEQVCVQRFTGGTLGGAIGAAAASAQAEIVCSVNTAEFDDETGEVVFPNGQYEVQARLHRQSGEIAASTSTTLVFNNTSHFVLTYETTGGSAQNLEGTLVPAGSNWQAGDVVVTVVQANFGTADDEVETAFISLTSSGTGVTGASGCTTTADLADDPTVPMSFGGDGGPTNPDCPVEVATLMGTADANGVITVTFDDGDDMDDSTAGVRNVEDILTFGVSGSVTAGGESGPTCVNPHVTRNAIAACVASGAPLFQNPLRLDNLAPRFVSIAMPALNANNYFNGTITFDHDANDDASTSRGDVVTFDWGVDNQGVVFIAGAPGSTIELTSFEPLDETLTNDEYVFGAVTEDALGNDRTGYATATNTTVNTSATAGSTFNFGIDKTDPTFEVEDDDPIVDTTFPFVVDDHIWTFTYSDAAPAGAGPSGFGPTPLEMSLLRVWPEDDDCIYGSGGGCSLSDRAIASGESIDYTDDEGLEGYYRLNAQVEDAAGNDSQLESRLGLYDVTGPVVAPIGGPVAIDGGASATFTSSMNDNIELGRIDPFLGYDEIVGGAGIMDVFIAAPSVTVGTLGEDVMDDESDGEVTFSDFIVSLESVDPVTFQPTGNINAASIIAYQVLDVAGVETDGACPALATALVPLDTSEQNCTQRSDEIFSNVENGSPGEDGFESLGTDGPTGFENPPAGSGWGEWELDVDDAGIDVGDDLEMAATATGPAATFVNPWERVEFWIQRANGVWYRLAGTVSVSATDNTITDTRVWTYSLDYEAQDEDEGAMSVVAVGVNDDGRALLSNMVATTIDP
ncbi:MAG: Ig-like domain-containing protein [Gemmatimonadota bacterium]